MGVERAVAATLSIALVTVAFLGVPVVRADTSNIYFTESIEPRTVDTTGWFEEVMDDDFGINSQIPSTPFYDRTVEEIWWFSNGFVGMGDYDSRSSDTGCCQGGQIPAQDDVDGIVAGVWTDLDPSQPCGKVSRNITQTSIRYAMERVPYDGETCLDGSKRVTFWLKIFPSNGTIEVHLLRVDGKITATTGVEDFGGTVGNQTRRTDAELPEPIAWRFTLQEGAGDGTEALEQDDAGSGGDAGDNASTALAIDEGTLFGTLDPEFDDPEDWYAIDLVDGDEIAADLSPEADFEVAIHDPNGTELDRSGAGDGDEHAEAVASEDGTHYVRVWSQSGRGDYRLDVSVTEPVEPRVDVARFEGTIHCALDVFGLTTRDLCAVAPATQDETFPVSFTPGLTSIRTELVWSAADAIRPAERMKFSWTNLPGLRGAEGPSPVVEVQDVSGLSWTDSVQNGWVTVRPTQADLAAVDQPFDLCIWSAYGGASLPSDPTCG